MKTFIEINQDQSTDLIDTILEVYKKSQEVFTDDFTPPSINSLSLALKFSEKINGYKKYFKSVSALSDCGFGFRFEKNNSEHIEINMYDIDHALDIFYFKKNEEVKVLNLTFKDSIDKLKDILDNNDSKSKKTIKELFSDIKGKINWEGNLSEMRQNRL